MSKFKAWAERQFGPRPDGYGVTDDELKSRIAHGHCCADELAARELYDEKLTAALYGWSAGNGDSHEDRELLELAAKAAGMTDYTCHQIALMVRPVGESITSELATTIRVDSEGAGPSVVVEQSGRADVGRICIDVDEWPALRDAITQQIELCAELCREELQQDGESING